MTAMLRSAGRAASALVVALVVAAAFIRFSGGQPISALWALLHGGFGSVTGILQMLAKATPLILSGLAVAVALRGGMFNIGAEGQIFVGAMAAAWVGFAIGGLPAFLHLPMALAAGALAGAVWGAIPGLLKALRGAHEVVVTIMMNYVAIYLTHYLVNHPLRDPTSDAVRTPAVLATAQLPSLDDLPTSTLHNLGVIGRSTNLSVGLLLALLAALAVGFLFRRTALGFEIKAVGQNPDAARAAGISVPKTIVTTMAMSGALAGLAGAVEVLGVHRRFLDAFSPGYGFDSIAVALLGGLASGGVVLAAMLFGGLSSGALQMELLTDVPKQITGIIQAVVILAVGARFVRPRKDAPLPAEPIAPVPMPDVNSAGAGP